MIIDDPIALGIASALLGAAGWALFTLSDGQKQLAQGISHIIGNPTERERQDALELSHTIREHQAASQASAKAQLEQTQRQIQLSLELQQRTVFLLEQIFAELKTQNKGKV